MFEFLGKDLLERYTLESEHSLGTSKKKGVETFGEGKGKKVGNFRNGVEWKDLIEPLELTLDKDRKLVFSITQDAEERYEPKVNMRIKYLNKKGEYVFTVQGFTFPIEYLELLRGKLSDLDACCEKIGI